MNRRLIGPSGIPAVSSRINRPLMLQRTRSRDTSPLELQGRVRRHVFARPETRRRVAGNDGGGEAELLARWVRRETSVGGDAEPVGDASVGIHKDIEAIAKCAGAVEFDEWLR